MSFVDRLSWIYISSVFVLASLIYATSLLDFTLLPRFACASLFLLLISAFLVYKKDQIKWPPLTWPLGLLIGFYLINTFSILWAANFSEAVFESQKVALALGVFYCTSLIAFNDIDFERKLIKSALLITSIGIVLAFWQLFGIEKIEKESLYQVSGFAGHKNLFSAALFLLLGFHATGFIQLKGYWKIASIVAFIISLLLIMLLQARSTYLAIFVVSLFVLLLRGKIFLKKFSWKSIVGLSTAALIMIMLTLGFYARKNGTAQLLDKLNVANYTSSETGKERLHLWKKTICTFKKSPVLGVGAGNWQTQFPDCTVHELYSVELNNVTFQRPHNDFLWVMAETGLIGLLLYLGFFCLVLARGVQSLAKEKNEPNQWATLIRLSSITGILVIAFFSFPKERIELLILAFTFCALIDVSSPTQMVKEAGKKLGLILLSVLALAFCLNLYTSQKRWQGESNMKSVLINKRLQNHDKVIEHADLAFSKWYTIDPTSIPVHWYRGTSNFVKGNHDKALVDFQTAQLYAPYNQHVWNDLGSAFEMNKQRDRAKECYLESIRISPMFDDPRLNTAILYYNEGDYQEALDWANSLRDEAIKKKYVSIISEKIK